MIRNIVDKIGDFDKAGFNRITPTEPVENPDDIFGILPKARFRFIGSNGTR